MKKQNIIKGAAIFAALLLACNEVTGSRVISGQTNEQTPTTAASTSAQTEEPPGSTNTSGAGSSESTNTSVAGSPTPTAGTSCAAADLYVAPLGSGSSCTCALPCSLETGRDNARAQSSGAQRDIVVLLADGTYRLTQTFTLGAADSGPGSGYAIIYRAAPGATPILSGAMRVQGFTPVDASNVIWVANVPSGIQSRQLWVNGRRAARARGPTAPSGYTQTATGFTLGDTTIAGWPDRTQLEVVGMWGWMMYRCPVVSANATGGLVLAQPCWNYGQGQFPSNIPPSAVGSQYYFNSVVWLENSLELLSTPGQFFLDVALNKLYYAPRAGENLATADVELPIIEMLVNGAGTPSAPLHDVTFDGITFAYGTWLGPNTTDGYIPMQATITMRGSPAQLQKPLANVTMHATHNVSFLSCTFEHLGGAGLAFEVGAQSNLVDSSRFADISASAIMVGDVTHTEDFHPSNPTEVVQDNTVSNSYITQAGAEYYDAVGIFIGYTTHTTIKNNELFDLPYSGISAGWGWGSVDPGGSAGYTTPTSSQRNDIEHNIISYHMRQLNDGGALYGLGAQPGAIMNGNVMSNQAHVSGNIYLDAGSQYWMVTNNVVLVEEGLSYWISLAGYSPMEGNNTITSNFSNTTATSMGLNPIHPSDTLNTPVILSSGDLSPAASIIAAAGTPLHSPEIAQGQPATASSVWDANYPASAANNGDSFGGWSPTSADTNPWWQVDLGRTYNIDAVEVVSRWSTDQPVTRRNYQILASNDPTFATSTVIGTVDGSGLAYKAIFAVEISPPVAARYVRVTKTASEYFFLGQVRVHGK